MSVTVRPYRGGPSWEVDINVLLPDGTRHRERKKTSLPSKTAATRWGEQRERALLLHGATTKNKEVPTLQEFESRFLDGHARANRQKPSGIAGKESILKVHLMPTLGKQRLDAITNEDVQRLKLQRQDRSPKTINNILTVLNTLLKKAVEWDVIERMPCVIRLLPVPKSAAAFHDFSDYERLVKAAHDQAGRAELIVLLGGEAGLRLGEITALEWRDVDLEKRQLCVRHSDWRGQVTMPKGGRLRYVPLTTRLAACLRHQRHLRATRVLCEDDGRPFTTKMVSDHVRRAAKKAQLTNRGVHVLRHTFCSHLAMRGAAPTAIQALAGHQELGTTQRYLHLTPAALDAAIRLLESPGVGRAMEK